MEGAAGSPTTVESNAIPKQVEKRLQREGRSKPGKRDIQDAQGILRKGAFGKNGRRGNAGNKDSRGNGG